MVLLSKNKQSYVLLELHIVVLTPGPDLGSDIYPNYKLLSRTKNMYIIVEKKSLLENLTQISLFSHKIYQIYLGFLI